MKILIIGDCHGQWLPVIRALRQARKELGVEAAIQVGDFGFYHDGIAQLLTQYNGMAVGLYVIDGNHEDHEYIADGLGHLAKRRIFYCKRGSTLDIGGAKIGFCGGALNVDRPQECNWDELPKRVHKLLPENPRWSNWLTIAQAERAAVSFDAEQPDLVVTHSCPARIGVGHIAHPQLMDGERQFIRCWGIDPGPAYDVGEPALTHLWNKLKHRPANWVYGHFHQCKQRQVEGTTFTCVGSADLSDGFHGVIPWIYDTVAKTLTAVGERRLTG